MNLIVSVILLVFFSHNIIAQPDEISVEFPGLPNSFELGVEITDVAKNFTANFLLYYDRTSNVTLEEKFTSTTSRTKSWSVGETGYTYTLSENYQMCNGSSYSPQILPTILEIFLEGIEDRDAVPEFMGMNFVSRGIPAYKWGYEYTSPIFGGTVAVLQFYSHPYWEISDISTFIPIPLEAVVETQSKTFFFQFYAFKGAMPDPAVFAELEDYQSICHNSQSNPPSLPLFPDRFSVEISVTDKDPTQIAKARHRYFDIRRNLLRIDYEDDSGSVLGIWDFHNKIFYSRSGSSCTTTNQSLSIPSFASWLLTDDLSSIRNSSELFFFPYYNSSSEINSDSNGIYPNGVAYKGTQFVRDIWCYKYVSPPIIRFGFSLTPYQYFSVNNPTQHKVPVRIELKGKSVSSQAQIDVVYDYFMYRPDDLPPDTFLPPHCSSPNPLDVPPPPTFFQIWSAQVEAIVRSGPTILGTINPDGVLRPDIRRYYFDHVRGNLRVEQTSTTDTIWIGRSDNTFLTINRNAFNETVCQATNYTYAKQQNSIPSLIASFINIDRPTLSVKTPQEILRWKNGTYMDTIDVRGMQVTHWVSAPQEESGVRYVAHHYFANNTLIRIELAGYTIGTTTPVDVTYNLFDYSNSLQSNLPPPISGDGFAHITGIFDLSIFSPPICPCEYPCAISQEQWAPHFPDIPTIFSFGLEILGLSGTTPVVRYYYLDYDNDRIRFDFDGKNLIYLFSQNTVYFVDNGQCAISTPSTIQFEPPWVTFLISNDRKNLADINTVFRINNPKYVGKSVARGIPADVWQSDLVFDTPTTRYYTKHFFADAHSPEPIPLRTEFIEYNNDSSVLPVYINYEYFDYTPSEINFERYFRPPNSCVNISQNLPPENVKDIPNFPEFFSFSVEVSQIVDATTDEHSGTKVWNSVGLPEIRRYYIDFKNGLLRVEHGFPNLVTEIFRVNEELRLTMQSEKCTAENFTDHFERIPPWLAFSFDPDSFNLKSPQQFFRFNNATWVGTVKIRGILCNQWVSRVHTEPDGDQYISNHYFSTETSETDFASPVRVELVGATTPLHVVFDYFNFQSQLPKTSDTISASDSLFRPLAENLCQAGNATIPEFPSVFFSEMAITVVEKNYTSYRREWHDNGNSRVEIFNESGTTIFIADKSINTTYLINFGGSCSAENLQNLDWDILEKPVPLTPILSILTPWQNSLKYLGVYSIRGIACDAWGAFFNEITPQHETVNYTTLWYFSVSTWSIKDRNFSRIPVRISVQGTITNSVGISSDFNHIYEFVHYSVGEQSPSTFVPDGKYGCPLFGNSTPLTCGSCDLVSCGHNQYCLFSQCFCRDGWGGSTCQSQYIAAESCTSYLTYGVVSDPAPIVVGVIFACIFCAILSSLITRCVVMRNMARPVVMAEKNSGEGEVVGGSAIGNQAHKRKRDKKEKDDDISLEDM